MSATTLKTVEMENFNMAAASPFKSERFGCEA
jgi:hypothetical protein